MNDAANYRNSFFNDVRIVLAEARQRASTEVNRAMVEAYWQIGRRIVEEEQVGKGRAGYGDGLIVELSRRLGDDFGKGFPIANLKNFRQFFLTYPDVEKSYALRSELSRTHQRLIMRVADHDARQFYLSECASQHWSTRQLERNIQSGWHQRLLNRPAQSESPAPLSPTSLFNGRQKVIEGIFDALQTLHAGLTSEAG